MSPELLAALISAVIALIGYLMTIDKTRKELGLKKADLEIKTQALNSQIESATNELQLKRDELETLRSQLKQGLEEVRQEQFVEVLTASIRCLSQYLSYLTEIQSYLAVFWSTS